MPNFFRATETKSILLSTLQDFASIVIIPESSEESSVIDIKTPNINIQV